MIIAYKRETNLQKREYRRVGQTTEHVENYFLSMPITRH